MKINGDTQIIGFFGSTYKRSKMYAMYNAAFESLKLNYVYIPFAVTDLKQAVYGIRNLGIKGIGVTIPYKIEIIKYLDELDDNAKRIGAVNAVVNNNGKLIGHNSDGLGAVSAIKEVTEIRGKKVILLGSGGAARAVAFSIQDEGGKLVIANRTHDSGQYLANIFKCQLVQLDQLDEVIETADILINTTSVGMTPDDNKSLINPKLLHVNLTVMDLVTSPEETKLICDAKLKGCKIVYGRRMLFFQAVFKFKLFTGLDAPVKIMERALYA